MILLDAQIIHLCSSLSVSCPGCPHSRLQICPCWLNGAGEWVEHRPCLLKQQVWRQQCLVGSFHELMCLSCHCGSPVPLVTAGLVLSCVLVRYRVNHPPEVEVSITTGWTVEWPEIATLSLRLYLYWYWEFCLILMCNQLPLQHILLIYMVIKSTQQWPKECLCRETHPSINQT